MTLEKRDEETEFLRFSAWVMVVRCTTLLDLARNASPGEGFAWPQPDHPYFYLDSEHPSEAHTQSAFPWAAECSARAMDFDEWSQAGVFWLDCGPIEFSRGQYSWDISGGHLIGRTGNWSRSGPARPLHIFHLNQHDIERALALIREASDTALVADASTSSTSTSDREEDDPPFRPSFGAWTKLDNGNEITAVVQPFTVPAGEWWNQDLISTLPFAVTRAAQAERWPMFTIHEDLILRQKQVVGLSPSSVYRTADQKA